MALASAIPVPEPQPAGRWPTVVGLVAAAVLVLASGTGQWLLRREPRPVSQQVSAVTPVEVSSQIRQWLARTEPQTPMAVRLFPASLWSDYLLWDLPPSARVYWYTHWNVYTPRRMQDADQLLLLAPPPNDWRGILDRYRLNMLALRGDARSSRLFDHLLAEEKNPAAEWEIIYKGPSLDGTPGGRPAALVATRRVDPFVMGLAQAQAAQACVGGMGLAPWRGSGASSPTCPGTGRGRATRGGRGLARGQLGRERGAA